MTTYLFFTGGYDSTYRLCELLMKEKNAVQPIYISDPYIDNYTNNKTRRRNNSNETNSQEKIIVKIKKMFPETKGLLKDTITIDTIPYDNQVSLAMKELKKRKYIRRSKCQYGAMAQYCKNNNINVEVCAEKGGHFERKLGKKTTIDSNNNIVFDIEKNPELEIFRQFQLPLFTKTKETMLNEAKAYNFDDILKNTWSCWYPKKNKPCGKCIMCKERIVPYIEGFQTISIKKDNMYSFIKNNKIEITLALMVIILIAKFSSFS